MMRLGPHRLVRGTLLGSVAVMLAAASFAGPAPAQAGTGAVAVSSGSHGNVAVSASHHGPGRTRVYSRPRISTSWTIGWGPYWGPSWGPGWGGYWDPYWYGPRFSYTQVYPRPGAIYGALDTDVSPERAEVWVDGRKLGVADDFDGFPDYLWLEKGTYDVVFYAPGYKTIARQYTIYPGLVIDVEDRMERGEAVHPLDLGPATHERRDARIERDRAQRERAAADAGRWEAAPGERSAREEYLDARAEPGRLRLTVEPADASVYLDGRFVGTGGDLARLRAGLLVDSGSHRLEVVRPGYRSVERSVDVGVGEETSIGIVLEGDDAGDR